MIDKSCKWMAQDSKARLGWVLLPIVFLLSGCGISSRLAQTNVELRNAVNSFDRAIDALARQSADWQVVLQALEEDLVDDVQSTTRVELNNLMRTGLLSTGGEFRCDAEFLRIRMERELRRIRNEFVQNLNVEGLDIPLLPEIPVEPHICSAVPAAVDLSLDEERRAMLDVYGFDLLSKPITVEVVNLRGGRRNVTGSLAIISNQQMVLDLTQSGAPLDEDSRNIVFSWNRIPPGFTLARAVVSDKRTVLGDSKPTVLTPEETRRRVLEGGRSALGEGKPIVLTREEVRPEVSPWYGAQCVIPVLNPAIEIKCQTDRVLVTGGSETFTPPKTRGDREFKGHGPCVMFSLTLKLDAERKKIWADYWMKAWECPDDYCCNKGDKTKAEGWGSVTLFEVTDPLQRILGYDLESNFHHDYIDDDHEDDIYEFGGLQPVEQLTYVGDTSGDEAGTRTQVTIDFRNMYVTVEKCESSE